MAWLRWGRRSDPELTEMGALLCWCLCWRYRYTYRMQIQMKIQMRQPSNYNSFGLRGHRVYKKILYLHPRDIELSHCSHLPSRKRLFRGWVRLWTVDKLQNNNVAFIVRHRKAGWDGDVWYCHAATRYLHNYSTLESGIFSHTDFPFWIYVQS